MARWLLILRKVLGGGGAFPHELWWLLEFPGRRWLQSPEVLSGRLGLSPDSRVLEIGPGSGFFSVAIARRITEGRLTLLDIQPEFLERARRRLEKAGFHRVACIAADASATPLPDASFDVAVMVHVLGEVGDRAACLREVVRVLKPGGILSVTERRADPDFIPRADLNRMASAAGLQGAECWGQRWAYTANFTKAAPN